MLFCDDLLQHYHIIWFKSEVMVFVAAILKNVDFSESKPGMLGDFSHNVHHNIL